MSEQNQSEQSNTSAPAVASGELLAEPVEIPDITAFRAFCTLATIYGTQIAILGGSVEALGAAWARLLPDVPFKPEVHQQVIVISAKDPVFKTANAPGERPGATTQKDTNAK